MCAGHPTTITPSGTSLITTAPAPIQDYIQRYTLSKLVYKFLKTSLFFSWEENSFSREKNLFSSQEKNIMFEDEFVLIGEIVGFTITIEM